MPPVEARETRDLASELKFTVDASIAEHIREWARPRLLPDPHATGPNGDEYTTTTIYYDTQDLAVYHRRGSFGRSKYRIRRYNEADAVFLERKLRAGGIVSKRRTIVRVEELAGLAGDAADRDWPGFWFHQRVLMRRLRPVGQVTYHRMARVAMTDYGPVRLTLDQDLQAVAVAGAAYAPVAGTPMLAGRMILEMKFRVQMPAMFRQLAEAFALRPERLSKYRLAIEAIDALGRVDVRATAPAKPRAEAPGA